MTNVLPISSGNTVINPDDFLETDVGRVWTLQRNIEAWQSAFAALERILTETPGAQAVVVCGLQGAGKSTWIAAQPPRLTEFTSTQLYRVLAITVRSSTLPGQSALRRKLFGSEPPSTPSSYATLCETPPNRSQKGQYARFTSCLSSQRLRRARYRPHRRCCQPAQCQTGANRWLA